MARIRSIKPEFWTDEKIVECSPIARLLFVGMWNFCDDGGNHPVSVKTIKMEVFPGDDFSVAQISGFIGELSNQGLIAEYEAEGRKYWHVMGWAHQKIDRPNKKYPCFDENSTIVRRQFDEQTPEDVDVDVDVDVDKPLLSSDDDAGSAKVSKTESKSSKLTTADCQAIVEKYNQALGDTLPRVQLVNKKRKSAINARFKELLNSKTPSGSE